MGGVFQRGEQKVRPGAYININQVKEEEAGYSDGVVSVLFTSSWGPLGKAVEINRKEGYETVFGSDGTTDAIAEVFAGGAQMAVCCRVGSGGTESQITLKKAEEDTDAVRITAKYPGKLAFSVTVRDKLNDEENRECIIYNGLKELERFTFAKAEDEISALAEKMKKSAYFLAEVVGDATGKLKNVTQEAFTTEGTAPNVTVEDYSNALATAEMYYFDTICVATDDVDVHNLLKAYVDRLFDAGQMVKAVVAEKSSESLETRMEHAESYNDEKMIYLLNSSLRFGDKVKEGYQTAARIAGMVSSCPSNVSLTHAVIPDATDIVERLTPTEMEEAEQRGCLVISMNPKRKVRIDSAINTLVTLPENMDVGWKKIRRVKTRQELIRRMTDLADELMGSIDNDVNGRATLVSKLQEIGNAMVTESKLVACNVTESTEYVSDGDSAYLNVDVIDKDSTERIYLFMTFRFSSQITE